VQALIDALSLHPALGLGAVFAAALLESTAVIGIVVPGSLVVFGGGVLVGLQILDPWWVALAAVSGATLGDGFNYWLGRRYHEQLRNLWPLRKYPELLDRGQAYFARSGGKGVFLGRFVGPLRAAVPVIAGMSDMPVMRFTVVTVLSAVAWAAAHLLPGALFGASLQLAGAVSSRLLVLLVGVVAVVWLCTGLLRLAQRIALPVLMRQRDRVVAWARPRTDAYSHVILSLLDPTRPEALGLLVSAVLILGGAWLFLGILEDVVSNDPLVQFDRAVFAALQNVRTTWADRVVIVATELGSAPVAIALVAAVSVAFALKRCWRTLAYWLTALGFAQALVWILKTTLGRARPIAMYSGGEQFSFPSGHAASSVVLYGFLAVLLSRGKGPKARLSITVAAALLIGLITFSRMYLGASWLSDALAGVSLGTAWVALLSIAYTQHVSDDRLSARAVSLTALGALVLAGGVVVATQHAVDVARYAPPEVAVPVLLTEWKSEGWQRLPAHRKDVSGDFEEPLSVQWVGTLDRIERVLRAGGWSRPQPWWSRSTLLWLVPSTPIGKLPVLAKLHQGNPPMLSLQRELDPTRRLVIRLWATPYRVDVASDLTAPLWIGMVTLERVSHPAGVAALAMTDQDFATPAASLAQFLQEYAVASDTRQRGKLAVLLIW
jgi:membrane protein DedA with SNARE-associated domain/membrane-associated phospholipid phosphatase